tara:strand:- start:1545 stop:1703 length:159 start_codon:yes stop_codon:yes gene_type:complete
MVFSSGGFFLSKKDPPRPGAYGMSPFHGGSDFDLFRKNIKNVLHIYIKVVCF